MTIGMTTAVRNARMAAIKALIDASGSGKIIIYDDTRPATGGSGTTALVTLTMPNPCGPDPTSGVLNISGVPPVAATAASTATWARLTDGAGTPIIDLDVGTEVIMDSPITTVGEVVSISTISLTEGNP